MGSVLTWPKTALDNKGGAFFFLVLPMIALVVSGVLLWEASRRAKTCVETCTSAQPLCKAYENDNERVKILNRVEWINMFGIIIGCVGVLMLLFAILYMMGV